MLSLLLPGSYLTLCVSLASVDICQHPRAVPAARSHT